MTPKEKSKQLIDKFDEQLNHLACGTNGIEEYIYEQARYCALIAVDEILDDDVYDMSEQLFENRINYWEEVKQEIEKL